VHLLAIGPVWSGLQCRQDRHVIRAPGTWQNAGMNGPAVLRRGSIADLGSLEPLSRFAGR